jgi:hypothetical protein
MKIKHCSIFKHVFFHVHGIYVVKFLNFVCVFCVKIETTIQYDHKELKLKQFIKNLKQQLNMIMRN